MQLKQQLKGLFYFFNLRNNNNRNTILLKRIENLERIIQEEKVRTEKLKSVFLNNVYHEIRTPMNSIIGFTELLHQDTSTDFKSESYISKIRESSEEFLNTIDQLVLASTIEAGNIKINRLNFSLDKLLNDIYEKYLIKKDFLRKTDISLLKNTEHLYGDLIINTDKEKLEQILINLIDNAFKFTNKGVIEFGYKPAGNNMILFYINDTGIGINNQDNARLFEKFYKLNYVLSKENKGLGLGLCIARDLINFLGGDIWMESNAYGGTTFKFVLPFEKQIDLKEKEKPLLKKKAMVS